jgi:hypothetical protein
MSAIHFPSWALAFMAAAGALAGQDGVLLAPITAPGIRSQFEIGAGRTIPTGDFNADASGDGFDGGWSGAARVTLKAPQSALGLRIDAAFSANSANSQLKNHLTTAFGKPSDETMTLIGLNAALTHAFAPRGRVTPSLFGGVGAYLVTIGVTSGGTTAHSSTTRLAWHVGGELTYRALFLEVRYVAVAAVTGLHQTTFFAITAGVRFSRRTAR